MFKYLLQGFILGLSYVAPIGTQNLYVINSALKRSTWRSYQTALITIFFDISLAICCFFGVGFLIDKGTVLKGVILALGSFMVVYIGIRLLKSAAEGTNEIKLDESIFKIITTCFVVTYLNPQAIIDGSLLLGGFKASLPANMSKYFIIGVCTASFLWFITITTIISRFKDSFNNKVIRLINIVCGLIILFYGLKLVYDFYKLIYCLM